jgi:DNA (cytosine-5)-methyltransferase 1
MAKQKDKIIEGDLTDSKIHARVIEECKGKVDVVVGGIPCQSFSLIGPRSGYGKNNEKFKEDQRDHLYKEFYKIVTEIKPKVIVIENVKGILSKKDKDGKKIIEKIISDFGVQYNLQNETGKSYALINAADFGVPQYRERVIIIGIRNSWKQVSVPTFAPTHFNPKTSDSKAMKAKGLLPYVTLYEAIGDLPKVKSKVTGTDLSEKTKKKIKQSNEKINSGKEQILLDKKKFDQYLEQISLSGKNFFEFIRPNGYKFIDHHVARSQQLSDIKLFNQMKEGETAYGFIKRKPLKSKDLIKYDMKSFKDKYRKQQSGKPSSTIFAHLEKDGNRFIHPFQARTLTPREAARLQSFPDHFIFQGPTSKKFKQIGNAVPPLLAKNIAEAIVPIVKGD